MVIFIKKKTKRNFTQSRATTNFSCGSGITAIDYLAYEIIGTTIKGSL
jgi:hypothetical protein